jgi:hypothetical protein
MTALELHAEVVERLGNGDDVFAAEKLNETAVRLADAFASLSAEGEGERLEEQAQAIVEPLDDDVETLLGVLLPVVEYGRSG